MRDIIKMGVILMVICVLAAGTLAATYQVTLPKIIKQKELEKRRALEEVIKGAKEFKIQKKDDIEFNIGYKDNSLVGKAVEVKPKGYGGPISILVGVNSEEKVSGIKILSHNETPGLGTHITDEKFRSQFVGKSVKDKLRAKEDIDAITGATISTQAVADGVKKALEIIEEGK